MKITVKNLTALKKDLKRFGKKDLNIDHCTQESIDKFQEYGDYEIGSYYSKSGNPVVLRPSNILTTTDKNDEIVEITIIY